ncbi:hypothetical protein TEA_007648 [Camellia sinensis var. sinensis]|uniref:glutathione transferase n=1 Tax=Camellia sinensis var. sinensis TaxID=542762 RepID=A0A4S4D9Y2_CAMSN|nr:hypothetical protein TEA_007648 [Camellia sinensis var. sinensis]
MRFIAFAYPKPGKEHIFKDPLTQGVVAAWIDVQDHQFNPPALKLINELIFKPKNGFTPDTTAVAEEEAKLAKVLDIYEERLGESKYLGGEKFTSADLTHLPNLYYLMQTPMNRVIESRPRHKPLVINTASIHTQPLGLLLVSTTQTSSSESINLEPYRPDTIDRAHRHCDFVFEDRRVSKKHFQILFDALNS